MQVIKNLEVTIQILKDQELKIRYLEQLLDEAQQKKSKKSNMSFSEALQAAINGAAIGRWHRDDIYVIYQPQDGGRAPELIVKTIRGLFSSWRPNNEELFAKDWRIIDLDS